MFNRLVHRAGPESVLSVYALPEPLPADPLLELQAAERADWVLLRLVACTAAATLVLALAGSLVA